MLTPPPPYRLRAMQLADLDQVLAIDRLAFPTPAKAGLYTYELTENPLAAYQVLLAGAPLVGYAGFWMLGDEAHVSTIATHPDWRGRGLGELLLLNLLYLAGDRAATLATLEVRRGNHVAQALYAKLAFEIVGERPRYYRDTGDDALILTVALSDAYYAHILAQARAALYARLAAGQRRRHL
ncbi:MAG: ribosomal protein S18-alanine N-acetyltransferase [Anaerolineales bacterium]|nr:ribosomal protein S18-alanine N-acetyltransferase [Anaerolineales bacterium]